MIILSRQAGVKLICLTKEALCGIMLTDLLCENGGSMLGRITRVKTLRALIASLYAAVLFAAVTYLRFVPGEIERSFRIKVIPYLRIFALVLFVCALIYFIIERVRRADEKGEILYSLNILVFTLVFLIIVLAYPNLYERYGRDAALLYISYALIIGALYYVIIRLTPLLTVIPVTFALIMWPVMKKLWTDINTGEGKMTFFSWFGIIIPVLLCIAVLILKKAGSKNGESLFFSGKVKAFPLYLLALFSVIVFFIEWMKYISGTAAVILIFAASAVTAVYYVISGYAEYIKEFVKQEENG